MNCFLCGSDQNEAFANVESFGFPLEYYQCAHCGFVFQSPENNQAVDKDFYTETYREIYQSSTEPTKKDVWVQEQRALTLAGLLQTLKIGPHKRILDIGASTGLLLETFQNSLLPDIRDDANLTSSPVEAVGVEPGDAYRSYAQQRGLSMYSSLEALLESKPEKFDLVSMIHVLEHLPNPVDVLELIRKELLQDDGVLLLEVPNFYAHESYELAHLACYTPHTLQGVLRQAGYHVFFFHRHGLPRSSVLNLYLTLCAQALPDDVAVPPVKRDHLVMLKRRGGLLYRKVVEKLLPKQAWLPFADLEN